MPCVDLVYFNAGGGHRASALALQQAITARGLGWTVRLVHLTEVLDPQGSFRKLTGIAPEDLYNKRLAHGLTLGLAQELKLLQALIRLAHQPLLKSLQQHWLRTEPDMVVSLIPNFNRALGQSLAASLPGVPFVTVLTDLADHPPHFWIEPGLTQHVVCGSSRAVQQARAAGHPAAYIHPTSGMIIRPDFYGEPTDFDRAARQQALGLDPTRPTGVLMFGGHGSRSMLGIVQSLPEVQLVVLCGHNARLAGKLRALPATAPRLILGFTPDVAAWMRLGDFFIGKPGPGALSEALQLGLPVVVTRNAWTMPQERYNTDWVRDNGFGLVLRSFRGIDAALPELLAALPDYRKRVAAYCNRAVFEVPCILERILRASASDAPLDLAVTGTLSGSRSP
ncbi:MAG: galactosyldiacylglycerol synthase [Betaproteobacteria bacterium]|nr:galactosyldiacylglycerol synthase [Betaproteobacteria bacterium]MDE2122811.1 galactosyldiacylglycerol synthase [Betaproteobacteria bacterium]MDE2186478.1 galactosyldiacylglycerol synthase [Betaproteobacteria bacterium]MDE2324435.1 galactosyldiacylglycerol synthase [Betaproteobacteria bacterium]